MWTDEAHLRLLSGTGFLTALVGAAFDASDITPPNLGHPSRFMAASMDLTTAAAGGVKKRPGSASNAETFSPKGGYITGTISMASRLL